MGLTGFAAVMVAADGIVCPCKVFIKMGQPWLRAFISMEYMEKSLLSLIPPKVGNDNERAEVGASGP